MSGTKKIFHVESSTLVLHICICCYMSAMFVCVQCSISREVRDSEREKEGWEIIYGLDSGKCLVFLDIFTFITRASMIYRVSLWELITFQTFCHCIQCLSVYLLTRHYIPHPPSPRGARGWWWWRRCASVCPRACLGHSQCHPITVSQSEASMVTSDQSEARVIPSLITSSRGNTKTICHRPQTDLANIYFYQSQ